MATAQFRLTNKTSVALVRGQFGCHTGYWSTEPPARVEAGGTIAWSADVAESGDPDGFVNYFVDGQPTEWVLVWWQGDGAQTVPKNEAPRPPKLAPTPQRWVRANLGDICELSVADAPAPAAFPIFHAPGELNVVQGPSWRRAGDRFYFAAGAAHDPDRTGYIEKILKAFHDAGIKNPKDVNAHGDKSGDLFFTTGENSWLAADKIMVLKSGGGYRLPVPDPTQPTDVHKPVDWRITKAVDFISNDLFMWPLSGSAQFNLAGYSTGSVVMAQAALKLAKPSTAIDFLVLIGCPINANSPLYHDLSTNQNIRKVIRIDIPGDEVSMLNATADGTFSVTENVQAFLGFMWDGNDHPHFKYAFNKNADADRARLAKGLFDAGVR